MKKAILSAIIAAALSLTACSDSSAPSPAPVPPATNSTNGTVTPVPPTPTQTADADIEAALPFIRTGASVATGAVLQFAVTQDSTRTKLANEMYSAAASIYSLSAGKLPTVSQFQSNILVFGGSQTDANYASFSTAVAGLYASYYPKLTSGNTDAKTGVDVLNAIAGGIEDATASYVTVPAPSLTTMSALIAPTK